MARIAIIGPGAVGAVVASMLAASGRHEVTLCGRRAQAGLAVELPNGRRQVAAEMCVDVQSAPAADWVLVTTKAYDSAGAAAWFGRLCGPETPVAVLQNGVEHRERFAAHLPAHRVVPVVVNCQAERAGPLLVRLRGDISLTAEENGRGGGFAALFGGTDVRASTTSDFKTAAWRKLCVNVPGAIPALLLRPAIVFGDNAVGDCVLRLVRECIAVGRAEGASLDDQVAAEVLDSLRASPPNAINSLHADRLAGRRLETDARNGAVVRIGLRHGIDAPCNALMVAMLTAAVSK